MRKSSLMTILLNQYLGKSTGDCLCFTLQKAGNLHSLTPKWDYIRSIQYKYIHYGGRCYHYLHAYLQTKGGGGKIKYLKNCPGTNFLLSPK